MILIFLLDIIQQFVVEVTKVLVKTYIISVVLYHHRSLCLHEILSFKSPDNMDSEPLLFCIWKNIVFTLW